MIKARRTWVKQKNRQYLFYIDTVSYTHLDVYKRQEESPSYISIMEVGCIPSSASF